MINNSFDSENKTQSKGNVSTKLDMSPGVITIQQWHKIHNQFDQRETIKRKRNPLAEDKKNIFILGGCMVKDVEGWELSRNVARKKQSLC